MLRLLSTLLLDYCFNALEENVQRLSYSVFLSDAFFQTQNSSKIGSLIIAAGLNCSGNGTLLVGVNTTFRFRENVKYNYNLCTYVISSNIS